MAYSLLNKLVVGRASRAIFDLQKEFPVENAPVCTTLVTSRSAPSARVPYLSQKEDDL